jgi:hypothetical protein|uniref:Uncharacterized protein n=1 Tax=Myoviridae sp. ctkfK18 TaxID=2825165 RepID=A0A8S5VH61_9CAUD|nr:MAG TPA: hypothetical protein [Myoviridae sp. ctkfK18]
MDKHIRMALNSSAIIANSSWEATCFNILEYSKRIRRSWKRKDVIRLLCLIDIADSFESYPFYVNVTEKYGLNKLLQKYMNRIFRYNRKYIRTSSTNHNNGRIYSMETIRKYLKDGIDQYIKTEEVDRPKEVSGDNNGLNIKFTFDTDNLYDKSDEKPKDEVKAVLEVMNRWKEYTGDTEPLPRMIYRGGGYEPY